MALDEFEGVLAAIAADWNAAEYEVKLGEQVNKKIVVPAIKELRYAGRRLADALVAISQGKEKKEIDAFLIHARFNCHCARHDAIDAATLKMAIDLDLMTERLGHEAVLFAFPKFGELYDRIQSAQSLIATARQKRENRGDIYAEIAATNFEGLVGLYKSAKACEPLMKKIAARTRSERWIAYAIGAAGVLAAFLFWLFPRSP
jgi:hypothetical protein